LSTRVEGAFVPEGEAVPIPGAPIHDVVEAYWRVLDALPEGTEDLVEEKEEHLPNEPMLRDPAGGDVGHLVAIEVAEGDIALLAAFADALDRAADPRPGPQFEALAGALDELGRQRSNRGMPPGDRATVALWVRRALSPILQSPFEGPRGAADYEILSEVLRRVHQDIGVDLDVVEEDEERAIGRVRLIMADAALGRQ